MTTEKLITLEQGNLEALMQEIREVKNCVQALLHKDAKKDAYSIKEAAERLGVSPYSIRKMLENGDLKYTQLADRGKILISAESVQKYRTVGK